MNESRDSLLRVALTFALIFSPFAVQSALAQDGAESIEEVVVVGSRRSGRSPTDSPVPVDVVTGEDFANQGTSDVDDMLRNLLPSYNVERQPISDAATLTRPANMRGLPADSTLILVNGKRRHRSAVIAELGGSLNSGSQGPDLAVIPSMAIERIEVLRDGASAQYGSDAIAGVINFVLKEDREGLHFDGKYGETFKGDGTVKQFGINWGMPLGPDGFANATLQWSDSDPTSRSLQRTDAQGLIDTGNSAVRQPYAQIWGAPQIEDNWAFFLNAGIDLTDNQELYAFGNYAQREVDGGFFFRNPNDRDGVFTQGEANWDVNGDGINNDDETIALRTLMDTALAGTGGDSTCAAAVSPGGSVFDGFNGGDYQDANPGCFSFNSWDEGGFTPQFGGKIEDISGVIGVRGTYGNTALEYDVSVSLGRNEVAFAINNTLNPSLGPESPRDFELGKYIQTEQSYNLDLVYPMEVEMFYSDLNVAFGGEYRNESFEIRQGDETSWVQGDFAFQGSNGLVYDSDITYDVNGDGTQDTVFTEGVSLASMSIGANGFAGFGPSQIGEFDRGSYAFYVDLEADVIESVTLGLAGRYENFDDFGHTFNMKGMARWAITDDFALRASGSSGFRAPTPGQANVTKLSTITVDGVLQQRGQIPPTNPLAEALGGEALDAEKAVNWNVGMVWDVTDDLSFTMDGFWIRVKDRISQTGTIDIADLDINEFPDLAGQCPANISVPACLELLGVSGAGDLSSVSFFTNDFKTTTKGVDLVGSYMHDWGNAGVSNFVAAWNYTKTDVDKAGEEVSRNRIFDLEHFNPRNRGIFTVNHMVGDFRVLLRASYYGKFNVGDFSDDPTFVAGENTYTKDCELFNDKCYGDQWIFDIEGAYTYNDRYTFIVGAQNFTNEKGPIDDDNKDGTIGSGNKYETNTPWGFDGGFWYLRVRADFN